MATKVFFYITPDIILLDLAGAVQVFLECSMFDIHYELVFVGAENAVKSSAGVGLFLLEHLEHCFPTAGDIIIVPGFSMERDRLINLESVFHWLNRAYIKGVTICSVCTGSFLLAKAGLLNYKNCTTHWRYTETLQNRYPALKVQTGKLFVKDGNIYTSAGVATGIDLALFLIEERHGIELAMKVAREMVVYLKREGHEHQESPYLSYRNHNDELVHKAQDWIISHAGNKITLDDIAQVVNCSSRNLTRIFKEKTGATISRYITAIRIEKATHLLEKTNYKFDYVAKLCGFKSPKQLRNILATNAHQKN